MMKFAEHLSTVLRKIYHYILLDYFLVEGYFGVGFGWYAFIVKDADAYF
jgi:hypothetical protein